MIRFAADTTASSNTVAETTEVLREVSRTVLSDIGSIASSLAEQTGELQSSARALSSVGGTLQGVIGDRLSALDGVVSTLQERTETMSESLQSIASQIQDTLSNAERRARDVGYQLAKNEFGAQPSQLARQLAGWKQSFPNHPAQTDMPAGLGDLATTDTGSLQQVAVFLPLSGNLEAQGAAIRNGMLMSYKENQGQFTLNFYDTQGKAMGDLYKQAIQEGANMIIGPLLKDQVEELLKASPTVPVLALNELDKPIITPSAKSCEGHDINITVEQLTAEIGKELANIYDML